MTKTKNMKQRYMMQKKRKKTMLLQRMIGIFGIVGCVLLLMVDPTETGTAVLIIGPLFLWMLFSKKIHIL